MKIWITALADMGVEKGNSRHLFQLLARLREAGHDATLLVSRQTPFAPVAGLLTVAMPRLPISGLRYLSGLITFQLFLFCRLIGLFRQGRPDVLYARHDAFLFVPALTALLFRIPLVSELNGILPFELHLRGHGRAGLTISRIIERWVYNRSRKIVVVAKGMADYLENDLGIRRNKIVISHNGADLEKFTPGDGRRVRRQLGVSDDEVLIGYVGGLQPYQGVFQMLEAVRPLLVEGLPVRVLIVGDGPEKHKLLELAGREPLAGRVALVGRLTHDLVPDHLRAMDICLLPKLRRAPGSPYEYSASPLKAFEYLACGKPIVANELPDFAFLAEAGASINADLSDRPAFAAALRQLVVDQERRKLLGDAGLEYAREHGSWRVSIGRVAEVLTEAIG